MMEIKNMIMVEYAFVSWDNYNLLRFRAGSSLKNTRICTAFLYED